MSLELIIRPEAEADIADAFDWYEAGVRDLGSEFLLVLDAIFNSIIRIILFIQSCTKMFVGHSPEDSPTQFSLLLMRIKSLFFLYFM